MRKIAIALLATVALQVPSGYSIAAEETRTLKSPLGFTFVWRSKQAHDESFAEAHTDPSSAASRIPSLLACGLNTPVRIVVTAADFTGSDIAVIEGPHKGCVGYVENRFLD